MRRLWCAALTVTLTGCAQPPIHELHMAAERVESARVADAAIFAPEALQQADVALGEAGRLNEEHEYLPAIHAAGRAVAHADEAHADATTARRAVFQKVERSLMELEGLLSMSESRGAAGDELAAHRARYRAIRDKAESDLLAALAEAEAFKPELLAFEQRFRN